MNKSYNFGFFEYLILATDYYYLFDKDHDIKIIIHEISKIKSVYSNFVVTLLSNCLKNTASQDADISSERYINLDEIGQKIIASITAITASINIHFNAETTASSWSMLDSTKIGLHEMVHSFGRLLC